MTWCDSQDGQHHKPSAGHAIGAWCNDCRQFVPLGHFVEPITGYPHDSSYFIDGRDLRLPREFRVGWDKTTQSWRRGL